MHASTDPITRPQGLPMTLSIRHQSLRTILEFIACAWTAVAAGGAAGAAPAYPDPLNSEYYAHVQIVQPDGRLLIGGRYGGPRGYAFSVKRLNPDGTADLSFNGNGFVAVPILGYYEGVSALAVQSDGKIIVGGNAADPVSRDDLSCYPAFCNHYPALVRLHADGTVDQSFNGNGKLIIAIGDANSGSGDVGEFGTLTKLALTPDGGILIYDGTTATAKVNANGTLDTSFVGTIQVAREIVLDSDGAVSVSPRIGHWWNPNESGSGYSLDLRHGVLVLLIYSYAVNGDPLWYIASGPLVRNAFTGKLDRFRGGQCISCPYAGMPPAAGSDGTVRIQFHSVTSATMTLPGGRVTWIQPLVF